MKTYESESGKSREKHLLDLDAVVREGARRMLVAVLEAEVEEFLGRSRYERSDEFHGYRNGYGKTRRVAVGAGTIEVRAPRVRDTVEPFSSGVLGRYQRQSAQVSAMIPELYLHGLATGDFELSLRGFLGGGASLSATSVTRLKEKWEGEYEQWRTRRLSDHDYAYVWCDGIYPKAGLVGDKTALLVVLGVRDDGVKELLAISEGYRESTESWHAVIRDLKDRGLSTPRVFVGDGALGLWGAIREVYPTSDEQRCWVHKMRNVMSCFPKRLHDEVKGYLREMYHARTRERAEELMAVFAERYRTEYPRAVDCLMKDQDALLTYYAYPQQHWVSLKTTNPIESIFAPVKLRTTAAKRIRSPRSALFLVFKLIQNAQARWRRINAPDLLEKVIQGVTFNDGQEVTDKKSRNRKAAA